MKRALGCMVVTGNSQGAVFTTLHFLCNLRHRLFVADKPLQTSVMQHTSVLGPFTIYKKVL